MPFLIPVAQILYRVASATDKLCPNYGNSDKSVVWKTKISQINYRECVKIRQNVETGKDRQGFGNMPLIWVKIRPI